MEPMEGETEITTGENEIDSETEPSEEEIPEETPEPETQINVVVNVGVGDSNETTIEDGEEVTDNVEIPEIENTEDAGGVDESE